MAEDLDQFRSEWKNDLLATKMEKLVISSNQTQPSTPAIPATDIDIASADDITLEDGSLIQIPKTPVPDLKLSKALEIYIKATQFERMGDLGSALAHYRQAIKLDEDVEQEYRLVINDFPDETIAKPGKDHNEAYYTYYNFIDTHKKPRETSEFYQFIDQCISESPVFIQSNPAIPVLLNTLPNELIVQCIRWLVLLDPPNLIPLSLVSKKMLLITRTPSLWSFLCRRTFIHTKSLVLDGFSSWMDMFISKPRIKFNGVYISRVNYLRQGYTEAFNQPIHMITYYRYLRFYSDGVCVSATTTTEPAEMVKLMTRANHSTKGIQHGTYTVHTDTLTVSLLDAKRPNTMFESVMMLSSAKQGRLIEYHTVKKVDRGNRSEIPLATLKPFQFSKVKSFVPQSAYALD